MPKPISSEREKLQELDKIVKRIKRKSLKDNTLDHTVQMSLSNMDKDVQYAVQITSPAAGVQPIYFVHQSFEDLKKALLLAETELNRKEVEKVFHENRINTYKQKIQAHQERLVKMESGEDEEEDEEIEMEKV